MGDNGERLKLLCEDYEKIAKEVTALGFEGDMLDIEIEVAKPQKIIEDEEKLINEMLETNAMSSTGRLFKLGVQVANAATVTKAGKKRIKQIKQKKAEQEKKLSRRETSIKLEAVEAYRRYLSAGTSGTLPEKAKDAKAILTFVLPILAPGDKISNFNTGPTAFERLRQFPVEQNGKQLWEIELEKHIENKGKTEAGEV